MTYDDLPAIIPIFPLSEVLLLPGGVLPLNIFEEKYVRMIEDVLGTHRMIGIVQPDEKARDQGSKDALLKTGCVGRISQFSETEDNRYLIMLKGVIRFEIGEEVSNILPYRQAEVNWKPYQATIEKYNQGPLPASGRILISPISLSRANQLERVYNHGLDQ